MSQPLPLVSVVVPAYNVAQYVRQSVDSALSQTYPEVEVIVVDDGSTDATLSVLREAYADELRVRVFTQANAGASAARNRGIAEARGEFIHFLDADEFLLPQKIMASYSLFQADPSVQVVYGHGTPVLADGVTEIPMDYPPLPSGDVFCHWINGTMSGGTYGVTSSFMVRRSALSAVGGFDPALPICHDWDLWLRLAARFPFAALADRLVVYRRIGSGLHANRLKMALDRLAVMQRVAGYGYERCLSQGQYQALIAGRWQTVALRHWEGGQRAQARAALRHAIAADPRHRWLRRLYIAMSYTLPASSVEWVGALSRRLRG